MVPSQPVGRLDGPRALGKLDRPFEEHLELAPVRSDAHLVKLDLILVDRYRRVRPLVRVDADHHHRVLPSSLGSHDGQS